MLYKSFLKKGTLTGVLFFCSLHALAQNWQDPQWLRLGDYRETLFGYESEADDQSFFASTEGKYNPEKELQALIKSVESQDSDPKKNVFCRFPARVRWLKKHRSIPEPIVECKEYETFVNRLAAKSVSVVFSSYYLNNPGSSFGHTFIRLGKQSYSERNQDSSSTELLDTGINYGALTGDANPVLFAIGGLTGFFSGNYNAIPYYYKVREYNDFETRDLWSYQLDLTQDEIDLMVDHIWELGHTRFDYYFLTENCSYHVLSILEAARPSLKLHRHMPRLYTIPSETLKALEAEKLVKKITFRASSSTQFYHQLNLLKKSERQSVTDLVYDHKEVVEADPVKKALIYDTAISLVDYKFAKEILKGEEKAQGIKRPLLVARSKIPVRSQELDYSDKLKSPPHLGHGQKRLMITGVNQEGKTLADFEWRFAFHDYLDNSIGYPPATKMEVVKAIYRTDGYNHQLRDFSFIDVVTLGKWDIFNKVSSWKVKLGQWQSRRDQMDLSTQGMQAGYGISSQFSFISPYVLAHGEASYVSEKYHQGKFAYGADAGFIFDFTDSLKFQSALEWRAYPWDDSRFFNEIRYSERKFGVGAYQQTYLIDGVQDLGLRVMFYF
ncbi:DUF4105 domain-containing protein [Peredibacter sp. HCB2-198]|uniref:Lnb N-terminal periplasmic domain-containing protein n=1 Tax=Peredibacter sp. HCB2-198 TaxID=3383025 RepID=UPI0038B4B43C